MSRIRALFAVLVLALLATLPGVAGAQPKVGQGAGLVTPPSDMSVNVVPLIGTALPNLPTGWTALVVTITNSSASPTRGEIRASLDQFGNKHGFDAMAPYAVPAGGTVTVRVPVHVIPYAQLSVRVVDAQRGPILETGFSAVDSAQIVLLDTSTSVLKGAINDTAVRTLYEEPHMSARAGSGSTLSVVTPRVDPATGDPVLPDRAALYDAVDAVLFRSDMLARLSGPELDALAGFVLAGGTLAVAMTRPEDARNPTIAALVGGEVTPTAVSSEALRTEVVGTPGAGGERTGDPRAPGEDMTKLLGGFRGGNLRGTAYGNSAPYGLGEVHLLAFDPTRKPAADDAWVRVRMIDLTRRAFDRRASVVFRPGAFEDGYGLQKVRKQLDPNESSRWGIAAAAVLLLVYAVIAGPINYSMAARRNKPLRALRLLPIFSAVTFLIVVGIGMVAKGVTGRARHLTLAEAGAGMSKASVRRYRGFFASRAKELTVRTTDATSLLRTAVFSEPGEIEDHLVVDREGARLENVNALPWQTIVMREDGLLPLGEGISIAKKDETLATVKNKSGRDLRAAVLVLPGGNIRYFAKIPDGATVESSAGREVGASPQDRPWIAALGATRLAGAIAVTSLNAYNLAPIVDDDAPGLGAAWQALEEAAQRDTNWFPADVPVLIAQMDGGEGRTSDAGLRLESDRLLVRVVGWGGAP